MNPTDPTPVPLDDDEILRLWVRASGSACSDETFCGIDHATRRALGDILTAPAPAVPAPAVPAPAVPAPAVATASEQRADGD